MRVLREDENSKLWTERYVEMLLSRWRTTESGNNFVLACQNDSLRLLFVLLCYFILCYQKILISAALKY